jgi:hypothetical protein
MLFLRHVEPPPPWYVFTPVPWRMLRSKYHVIELRDLVQACYHRSSSFESLNKYHPRQDKVEKSTTPEYHYSHSPIDFRYDSQEWVYSEQDALWFNLRAVQEVYGCWSQNSELVIEWVKVSRVYPICTKPRQPGPRAHAPR